MIGMRQITLPNRYEVEIFFGEDDYNNSAMAQQVFAMLMGWA